MITYSDLKNIYHAEKKKSSLSKINNDFYSDARELLMQADDSHRKHLTEILFDIYEMRKNKIMLAVARSHKPENLIPSEDKLYNELANKLEKFRNISLYIQTEIKKDDKKEGSKPEEKKFEVTEKPESEKTRIRIIKNIPAIIGSDLKHYELKENDEIEMPKIDAKILIENGVAIRI